MGILNKTKCTVIGPMQYSNGQGIRTYFTNELGKLGITVYDHYHKPFMNEYVQESEELGQNLNKWLKEGNYDEITKYKPIRGYDLSLIERSDFIIFHYIPGVITCGSWEEFFLANRSKRPIFFITDGGKHLTPIWVFWTIPHKYVYSSKEEVLNMLQKIDIKEKSIDSDRWRLMKEEFR